MAKIIKGEKKMKTYPNYKNNQQERKRFKKDGCSKIKIVKSEVVSYINKDGELIEKRK